MAWTTTPFRVQAVFTNSTNAVRTIVGATPSDFPPEPYIDDCTTLVGKTIPASGTLTVQWFATIGCPISVAQLAYVFTLDDGSVLVPASTPQVSVLSPNPLPSPGGGNFPPRGMLNFALNQRSGHIGTVTGG
jgi:hypothetical protein